MNRLRIIKYQIDVPKLRFYNAMYISQRYDW